MLPREGPQTTSYTIRYVDETIATPGISRASSLDCINWQVTAQDDLNRYMTKTLCSVIMSGNQAHDISDVDNQIKGVTRLIQELDSHKATGPDSIPA